MLKYQLVSFFVCFVFSFLSLCSRAHLEKQHLRKRENLTKGRKSKWIARRKESAEFTHTQKMKSVKNALFPKGSIASTTTASAPRPLETTTVPFPGARTFQSLRYSFFQDYPKFLPANLVETEIMVYNIALLQLRVVRRWVGPGGACCLCSGKWGSTICFSILHRLIWSSSCLLRKIAWMTE